LVPRNSQTSAVPAVAMASSGVIVVSRGTATAVLYEW
jgi:hypothetical protein